MRLREVPRGLWLVLGGGLALRVLLLPFIHPWDGNTFHNLFAQLAAGQNPYKTFVDLTLESRSRSAWGYAHWYEYYAYPPVLIYLYWPLAKIAALFVALVPHFVVPTATVPVPNSFPLVFLLLYKLPIWAADAAIGWILWSKTRSVGAAALFVLNPLVLVVSGAWMFDSIPALFTLLALVAFERERHASAGALLALGFLTKFYPLFLLPVFFLALVWRRDARAFRLVAAFAVVSLVLVAPFWPEIGSAFSFNASRQGGGLSIHQVFQSWIQLNDRSMVRFELLESPMLGAIVLLGGLGITYAVLDRVRPTLEAAITVTLLAFLLVSKVVNEQYLLWVLPFAILGLARRPASVPRRVAFHLLWGIPFCYLLLHVPVTAFWPGGLALTTALLEHKVLMLVASAAFAIAFTGSTLYALWAYAPPEEASA